LPLFFLLVQQIWEHVIYRWKGLENNYPMVYYLPPKKLN
jgi:hypothetical protein